MSDDTYRRIAEILTNLMGESSLWVLYGLLWSIILGFAAGSVFAPAWFERGIFTIALMVNLPRAARLTPPWKV